MSLKKCFWKKYCMYLQVTTIKQNEGVLRYCQDYLLLVCHPVCRNCISMGSSIYTKWFISLFKELFYTKVHELVDIWQSIEKVWVAKWLTHLSMTKTFCGSNLNGDAVIIFSCRCMCLASFRAGNARLPGNTNPILLGASMLWQGYVYKLYSC